MPSGSPGSRVSRETRLLLLTLMLSVVALLVLARIRFPERPTTPALVPPLLTQLTPPTPFEDLSNAVSALEAEVTPSLHLLKIEPFRSGVPRVVPALRLGPHAAVALIGASPRPAEGEVIARDRVTGLAVVRTPPSRAPEPRIWAPQRVEYPRYLLVTEASPAGASLRPVFVGALRTATSFAWQTPVWLVPRHVELPPGAFMFTTTGALVGLVVEEPDSQAVVPADALMAAAERLLITEQSSPGTLGIEVQAITQPIAAAVGVSAGVVVVYVDPGGPAGNRLFATDVIEALNDQPIVTAYHWAARAAGLAAGERVSLRVRRGQETAMVELVAANASAAPAQTRLGLAMRTIPGLGAEVTLVQAASIADRAGLKAGDILTRAAEVPSPTSAQVNRAFEAVPPGGAMLVAVVRGSEHLVLALAKP